MTLHPHSRYLHIGGDEVVNMGRCEQCHDVVRGHGGREELFRRHMLAVMKRVSSRWHSVRSLFWDDMVRKWDVERLKVSHTAYESISSNPYPSLLLIQIAQILLP